VTGVRRPDGAGSITRGHGSSVDYLRVCREPDNRRVITRQHDVQELLLEQRLTHDERPVGAEGFLGIRAG